MSEKSVAASRARVLVGALVLFAAVLLPLGVVASAHTYLSSAPACGGGGATGDD